MFLARFGAQFSESVLFRRFPALFRRFLSSEFSVFLCFSWFTFALFMTTNFVVFTSVASWKDTANAKIQQTIPVRQHFVGNDSLADRFSHAEAMPLVLGDVTLLRFGIGFTKDLRSQVLKLKQCPLSFTHPRTIYRTEKKEKTRITTKNASENKKTSAKQKNAKHASDQLEVPQTLRVFFWLFGFSIY